MAVLDDRLDVVAGAAVAHDDRTLDTRHRMLGQKLQDANVLPRAGGEATPLFQVGTQLREHRRQLPVLVHVGVIERRRLAAQYRQIMQRIEDLHAMLIAARMTRDHLGADHNFDVRDVTLDRHRAEREHTRHTVRVVVEAHGLILVRLGRLHDARIENARRQRQRLDAITLETLADRFRLVRLGPLAITQTTSAQMGVQLV